MITSSSKAKFTKVAYVCSPLRGNITENVKKAADFCHFTMEHGYIPYAPHVMFTQFMDDNIEEERTNAFIMSGEMLSRVDELWAFSENGKLSEGMSIEIAKAQELGLPVNYFTIPENGNPYEYIPDKELDPKSGIDPNSQIKICHKGIIAETEQYFQDKAVYPYFPGFNQVLRTNGAGGAKAVMRWLERINYMIFLISYFMNGCTEINAVNSNYDSTLAEKFDYIKEKCRKIYAKDFDLFSMVSELFSIVYNDALTEFTKCFDKFASMHSVPNAGDREPKAVLEEIFRHQYVSWTSIYRREDSGKVSNPAIVSKFLSELFGPEAETKDPTVTMYDFFNYGISFPTIEQRDTFVAERFIDTGTAYSCSGETMTEDYSF